jgi:hypothetical protein
VIPSPGFTGGGSGRGREDAASDPPSRLCREGARGRVRGRGGAEARLCPLCPSGISPAVAGEKKRMIPSPGWRRERRSGARLGPLCPSGPPSRLCREGARGRAKGRGSGRLLSAPSAPRLRRQARSLPRASGGGRGVGASAVTAPAGEGGGWGLPWHPLSRGRRRACEPACKPDSVPVMNRRRPSIWARRCRTGSCGLPGTMGRATRSLLGLAPGGVWRAAPVARGAGGLLHHRFTLACAATAAIGGLLSVPLSVGSPRLGVTQHRALWSPDFPRRRSAAAARRAHTANGSAINRC